MRKRLFNIGTLVLASAAVVLAGDQATAGNFGKAPAAVPVKSKLAMSQGSNTAINSNTMRLVVAKDATIAPKDYAFFEVPLDFYGADKVGIAVTTLGDSASKLTNVRIGVGWAAPDEWYVVTDMILGNSFYYLDHGGATVPVYGPGMKIGVFNDGTTPVKITQLSVYAVAR